MPQRTYSLHPRAVHTLMMVDPGDLPHLLSAFEWIAEDPVGAATESEQDRFGRTLYYRTIDRFHFCYLVVGAGRHVVINEILTDL
jgi:hypothetical protein